MQEKIIQKQLNLEELFSREQLYLTTDSEIAHLLESPEFEEFVISIEESLEDESTFDDLLSSKKVLGKALEVLKLQAKQK